MGFSKQQLPDPVSYFESENLMLKGQGHWRTTSCPFHGGSDSMRVNVAQGAWVCMACGEKGGDLLSFHMRSHNLGFVAAAKDLGAWEDDGRPLTNFKPAPLSPRQALEVLGFESTLAAIAAGNLANGLLLTELDRRRLFKASGRIQKIMELFQ